MPKTQGRIPNREALAKLTKYYDVMGLKIREQLMRIDSLSFSELEAMKIQDNVNKLTLKMNDFTRKWANESIRESYKDAVRIAKTSLDILGAKKDEFYDTREHYRTIERAQVLTARDFIRANASINLNVATYIHLMRQASRGMIQLQAFDLRDEEIISELLDDAIREGQSRTALDSLIRVHFKRELWERKFININGRNYSLVKYAKMVGRTRTRIVQSEAIKNMVNQFNMDLVEISDHGTECLVCQEFEGNTYSSSGKSSNYPLIPGWPPYHPNCMHSARITSEEAIEARREFANA